MRKIWFWSVFFVLFLITVFVGVFSTPQSYLTYLPQPFQNYINSYPLKLGIDLSGGSILEYKIDFEESEKKARLVAESNEEFELNFNKRDIATGVVKTLKKRIDPDGTKEVKVFSSQRGEDFFVSVELTESINTQENRDKLEKITSLEFKEPFVDIEEKKHKAEILFNTAKKENTEFDVLAKPLSLQKEGFVLNLEDAIEKELIEALPLQNSEFLVKEIFESEKNGWFKMIEIEPKGNGNFAFINITGDKIEKEVINKTRNKNFLDAKEEFKNLYKKKLLVSDLPKEVLEKSTKLEENDFILDNSYLVQKNSFDKEKNQYTYDLIDFRKILDSVKKDYEFKEAKEIVDARSVRVLYYSPQWKETALGSAQFKVAKVGTDPNTNYPVTGIEFTTEGAKIFAEITEKLSKKSNPLCGGSGDVFAIFVDGKEISSPCVSERIDGNAQISFNGSSFQSVQKEAQELVNNLNSGATPAPVELVAEKEISATLGERAFILSVKASLIGFVLVSLWMIIFYRFLGLLSVISLSFYALALIFLFKIFGFVLTLSGIAGVILSIGMAVDANILIFERIKEEIKNGVKFDSAVKVGFDKSWSSIRDSNISSLITCFILWALGTSIIKAFAITLGLGIIVSMFTAINFTRYLILGVTPKFIQDKKSMLLS
jgi:protein-export membrane protein SecD